MRNETISRLKNFLWRGKLRKIATIVVAAFVVLIVIGVIANALENEKEGDGSTEALRSEVTTPEPAETAEPTNTAEPPATVKRTATQVPPAATAVPLNERTEAEAIRQTVQQYHQAYNDAREGDTERSFIGVLRYVDRRAADECGGALAHASAYVLMKRQMNERWEVGAIEINELEVLEDGDGTAQADVELSSYDIDTGEPVIELLLGFHFMTELLSPTGWVFTAAPDVTVFYADGHEGPVYDPLVEVPAFCSR